MKTTQATLIATLLLASLAAPAGLAVAADASDTPGAAGGDWPMFKGDAGRAGAALDGPDGEPVVRWQVEAGAQITGNVSVVGDLVLASSDDGVLHGLDSATGRERWRYAPGGLVSPPTAFDGSVYVFVDGNDLVSLDLTGGAVEWTMPDVVPGPTYPTAGDGALFIGTDDGVLVAVEAATGQERWRTQVSEASGATHRPAFADGRVYVASDGGGFVAVEAADGAIAWRFDTGAYATGTAVVADGVAYVGSAADASEGRLWAVDATSGEQLWVVEDAYHSPSVADGVAFSGSAALGVAAHDIATGEELWTFAIDGVARPLAVAEGVVYVPADEEKRLYALDAESGAERWHVDLDEGTDCCVAVADGVAFIGTWTGSLYAIGAAADDPIVTLASTPPTAIAHPNPFTVVDTLDPSVTGLSGAASLAFGPDGNIYVAQTTPPEIAVLSPVGAPIRSFGSPGAGPGQLDFGDTLPAIAVAQDGHVYVTEAGNSRVSMFEPDGTFMRHIGSFGDEPGRFLLPFDIVVDGAEGIHVVDDVLRTVSRFEASGAFEWRLDPHSDADLVGYFHGGAWDEAGNVWLTNDDNGLVIALGQDGSKLETWSTRDAAPELGLTGPCQMALDGTGNAYVLDCSNRTMAVFDPEHRLVGAWTGPEALPFGSAYAFGPDGRLYALAGGDRADGGAVDQPDAILVMEVALPEGE